MDRQEDQTSGNKFDSGKPRIDLISAIATIEKARVYEAGARKYQAHNWRKGLAWSRLIGATLRHIFAWMGGEDNDQETGINHLAHAACSLDFLLEYAVTHKELDDRYKRVPVRTTLSEEEILYGPRSMIAPCNTCDRTHPVGIDCSHFEPR